MSDNAGALFKAEFSKMTPQLQAALPPHISVERFVRIVLTGVQEKPELLNLDRNSLFRSCLKCAQDGLLPDGREAALVPYKGIIQYQPMYQGLLKKIRNSGELASIVTHVVYMGDLFKYVLGDDEKIVHEPCDDDQRGTVRCVYAIAKLKDGTVIREVMSYREVEKVRSSSRMSDGEPWTKWWDQQARKTVLKRIAKWLPSSTDREREEEVDRVITQDNEEFDVSRQIAQNGMAAAAHPVQEKIMPLPAVQNTQPALTLPPDPISRTQTRTAEVAQQIKRNTAPATQTAQQTQPAPVQQAAAPAQTQSVPVEEQWGGDEDAPAQAGQDLNFPPSELNKNSVHQPAAQTVTAASQTQTSTSEEPKKRKPRGGFVREGMSGEFKKVGGDPETATNTAAPNAAVQTQTATAPVQQAAVTQTAPAPAAAPVVANDGVEDVDSAVVAIVNGFQTKDAAGNVTGFRFVTSGSDMYYTSDLAIAAQIKHQFMVPELSCLVWYVTGSDKRPMIQKVEPAPKG